MMYFSVLDGHLGHHLEHLQVLFYFILRINEHYLTNLTIRCLKLLQNSRDMDVLQYNNKLCIVEDIEYMG